MIVEILLGTIALNTFIAMWQCHEAAKRNRVSHAFSKAWMKYVVAREMRVLMTCPMTPGEEKEWAKQVDLLTDVKIALDD